MQIAGRHVLRSLHGSGGTADALVEPRGFNLIKDSIGWSGFQMASATATARWTVDPSGTGAVWANKPVMQVSIYSGGAITGPSIGVVATGSAATASFWLMLPSDHQFTACGLRFSDQHGAVVRAAADLAITGTWQRLSATLPPSGEAVRIVTAVLEGDSKSLMSTSLLTQCWQIEPGSVATSYIPSSSQIGIREADDLVALSAPSGAVVDQAALNQAINRVIPAGSIAWTRITS